VRETASANSAELTQAREAANAAAAQLTAIRGELERAHQAAAATSAQLATANEQKLRVEELLSASRKQCADLERTNRELEQRCAQFAADRQADRLEFHEMVRTEQSKVEILVTQQAIRDAALADIGRLLQEASTRTERLLGGDASGIVPVPPVAAPVEAIAEPSTQAIEPAPASDATGEETSWQF
jgi:chromosome segregation ATPase